MAQFILSAFADEASDSLDGQIKALKRNNIKYIELRNVEGPTVDKTDDELISIRNTLNAEGIEVSSLGSPIGKDKIENDFEPHFEKFKRALEICKILGTGRMRMFSFYVNQDELDKYRSEVFRRLSLMVKEAEGTGIKLCHENESGLYGQNPERVKDILDSFPGLYGVFDAANYITNDKSPEEGIDVTLPRLEYIHVKDAVYEGHFMVGAGDGDGKYPDVLKKVDASTDRTVVLTVEPHLFQFQALKNLQGNELTYHLNFKNSDESFDFAVNSIKKVLTNLGYREDGYIWKK